MNKFILIAFAFILTHSLMASGFALPEQGAKSIGMGNAFSAVADDPSALFYNPAGINQLEGDFNFNLAASFILPKHQWKHENSTVDTKEHLAILPSVNLVYRVLPKLSVGFSFNAPYGSKIEWPDKWEGSHLIEMMNLQMLDFSLAVSYEVFKNFNLALSYDFGVAAVELRKRTSFGDGDYMTVRMATREQALAHGFKAALLYRYKQLRTGFVFKYGKSFDFKGNADFDIDNDVFRNLIPQDQKMELTLTLPMEFIWGISYEFIPKVFLMSFDVQYTLWSSYKELRFEFEKMPENVDPKNWKDVFALRIGAEYKVLPELALRAGYSYDFNPAPDKTVDPSLPDSDRHVMNVGVGYNVKDFFQIDLAYTFLLFTERVAENEHLSGTYNSNVNILSLSTSFKF